MGSNCLLSFATLLLSFTLLPFPSFSGRLFSEFLYPNFTASNLNFIDNSGAFLSSPNDTFRAAIVNAGAQQTTFYFSVLHVASRQIIWSANRNSAISNSDKFALTNKGITISDATNGSLIWSTPTLSSVVRVLALQETGNLILLDQQNRSLWESFSFPTDTIVSGQQFSFGKLLSNSASQTDLSTGGYELTLTDRDAVLQWNGVSYWRLSMESRAFVNSNQPVVSMVVNATGLYLLGTSNVVILMDMNSSGSDFRIAKLDFNGHFVVQSYLNGKWIQELNRPRDDCGIPNFCSRIGICAVGTGPDARSTCSCPSGFRNQPGLSNCIPASSTESLHPGCDSNQSNSASISYTKLGPAVDYFANSLPGPSKFYNSSSTCENLCSGNCSCVGYFYSQSTGSCFLLKNPLGSFVLKNGNDNDRLGYIKILSALSNGTRVDEKEKKNLPLVALVLFPCALSLLITFSVIWFFWWRKQRLLREKTIKLGRPNSNSSTDFDILSISGLPVRFNYEELEVATDKFSTHIGSGGFGAVYKGTLLDKTTVAVKKIYNLGNQGKKEFCTEIAIIGKTHHVNLVKLRGFCAQGRQRLLVYEYMNRGSLDRSLFHARPVLEWQERVAIALGTARGLAYLHSGCEHKIIHCDIKPENILLHDHSQVKISDFGLSKLLSPEQSSHFTTMRGTRGYLAPEWLTSSAISDKTDVYSYGMVLLEIVSGRKNCSMKTQNDSTDGDSSGGGTSSSSLGSAPVYFPLFALEMHEQRRYLELADPRLEGRVTNEDVEKLICVALCCVQEEPMSRPSMVTVVGMLEGGIPLVQPRVQALNFLRFYGRRFIEASVLGSNMRNEIALYPRANVSQASTTSGGSFSYISSQQISGPR